MHLTLAKKNAGHVLPAAKEHADNVPTMHKHQRTDTGTLRNSTLLYNELDALSNNLLLDALCLQVTLASPTTPKVAGGLMGNYDMDAQPANSEIMATCLRAQACAWL